MRCSRRLSRPRARRIEHLFVLPKPDEPKVYHPVFSSDGKFLLTGLTRTREAPPAEPRDETKSRIAN